MAAGLTEAIFRGDRTVVIAGLAGTRFLSGAHLVYMAWVM